MFAVSFLFSLVLAQGGGSDCTTSLVLTANDASRNTYYGNDWVWRTDSSNNCEFQAGEEITFTVDLGNLEGTNNLGEKVTLEGEEGVDLRLSTAFASSSTVNLDNFDVTGYFDDDADSTWSSIQREWTECDFGRKVQTFKIRNKASYIDIAEVEIVVQNDHTTCELAAAVRAWLTAILIILGVCCGVGILICILVACGCIACCNQNKTTQVHHTTVQTVAVPQQGGGEFTPSQPTYGASPGGTGAPDMTQYSTDLQPGWEAKWDVATNRPYWVDHNNQQSVWEDPRTNMGSP